MSERSTRTMNAFLKLSTAEQSEFFADLQKMRDGGESKMRELSESIQKGTRVSLGPMTGGCPYCGRS